MQRLVDAEALSGGVPSGTAGVRTLIDRHEAWRRSTINLIASENRISAAVRSVIDSDLEGRYASYPGRDLQQRSYRGNRYIVEIEEEAAALARDVFGARYVELRPLAGHIAGIAVIMGLCRPGDSVLEIGNDGGGHLLCARLIQAPAAAMTVHDIPFDGERYNVDVAATLDLIESTKPRLVIVGSSNFLFPHPVRELVDAVHDHDGFFAYDGSHVMGFLAAGQFQDPLREGADVVFGSTHKTFPGPQGGIIFSNRDDIMASITTSVRSLVGNHHPSRIPGMVVALLEMKRFGRAYMDAVRVNAQDLGNALAREGVPCVAVDGRFSDSHCVLARVTEFGSGTELALRLEEAGIITTSTLLPDVQGPQGIRLGVQEITRLGADEQTIAVIARLIADVIGGRRPLTSISKDAAALATSLNTFQYTFD